VPDKLIVLRSPFNGLTAKFDPAAVSPEFVDAMIRAGFTREPEESDHPGKAKPKRSEASA
jgi:hypothetical protein